MTEAIETKPEEKKHPLLAMRDKVGGFFKGVFTPTPPPPTEYQVIRPDRDRLGIDMTTLAVSGWRFLAVVPDGVLMGRNHKSVVQVDGEVQIYHRNNSTPYDYGYRSKECCDHKHERTPHPDTGEKTIHIPEKGDGQFEVPEKKPDPFQGLKGMIKDVKTEIKTALEEDVDD